MADREVNLAELDRRLSRLFDVYGQAPVTGCHKTPPPDVFERYREDSEAGYLGSAYALIRRDPAQLSPLTESMTVDGAERERVLLILGRGGSRWGVPGGGQEGDETFEATAEREIREEVGLEVDLTDLGHVRHEVATCPGYDERLHVLRVFFHAAYRGGSIAIQPGELNGAAWFAEPPDRLLPSTRRLLDEWRPTSGTKPAVDDG